MKTYTSQKIRRMALAAPALLGLGLFCLAPAAHAIPTAPQDDALVLPEKSKENSFEYLIEGRPDPFVPFISKSASSTRMDEIIPVEDQLTGMQLFEPGQLNLVAIVMVGKDDFAMAEDTTGKGYILHEGMKIGKRGVITAIEVNKVVIEETAFTRAGKKLTNNILMLLKKEGEE